MKVEEVVEMMVSVSFFVSSGVSLFCVYLSS